MAVQAQKVESSQEIDDSVPEGFANQLARQLIILHEKDMDPVISSRNAATFIVDQTNKPGRYKYYLDACELLLEDERSEKFAALTWAALIIHSDENEEYNRFVSAVVQFAIEEYYDLSRPQVQFNKKKYSGQGFIFGASFIKMLHINGTLFDAAQEIYTDIIRKEMALEAKDAENKEEKSSLAFRKTKKKRDFGKKLYDDIIDYIFAKGSFKSTSLNQENPNEFMLLLADRLRGTRRYVIQDIMNKRALERKKRLEKELSERLASAEEMIMANDPFCDGLNLFWKEKRYNYKFLAVEKIRMALQIIGVITGVLYLMASYQGMWGLHWMDGIFVCFGMYVFSKFAASRKRFKSFYPYDVSKELENCSTNFINILRRMSKEQLDHFLTRQIKNKRNEKVIQIIPEFVKYLYAIMPDRKNMILTVDELSEVMENIEIDIAKQLRGRL
ncbi:MAG: hypothetical protein HQM11_10165 [SAR324 cluster bacterium]|nr:hypothetical protein [SAR324 cluster bacterium]